MSSKQNMTKAKRYGEKIDNALRMWVKLARAYSTFNKRTVDNIRTFGLTQPQFGVLECLGHLGPMTIGTFRDKMLISGGNTTVIIDNLERINLIERNDSKDDRRAIIVQLTSKGEKLFGDIFPQHAEYVAKLTSVLTNEEQKELSLLLKKLGLALNDGG